MAGLCAFLFPGLGHLIVGKPFQAMLWFVGIVTGYLLFIVPGLFLHIGSIVHAVSIESKQKSQAMTEAIRRAQTPPPPEWVNSPQAQKWKHGRR
jgi:hypothetical protein